MAEKFGIFERRDVRNQNLELELLTKQRDIVRYVRDPHERLGELRGMKDELDSHYGGPPVRKYVESYLPDQTKRNIGLAVVATVAVFALATFPLTLVLGSFAVAATVGTGLLVGLGLRKYLTIFKGRHRLRAEFGSSRHALAIRGQQRRLDTSLRAAERSVFRREKKLSKGQAGAAFADTPARQRRQQQVQERRAQENQWTRGDGPRGRTQPQERVYGIQDYLNYMPDDTSTRFISGRFKAEP